MSGNNGKIRHVNGAGVVRWFTPAVAANKAAMNSGGWFPQPEAHEKKFTDKSLNTEADNLKEEIERYKALFQEKENTLGEVHTKYDAALKLLSEEKDAVIAELTTSNDLITELRAEIDQLKSEQATTKKATKKDESK